ncbi:c75b26c0-05be-41b4-8df2-d11e2c2044fd [Sclerotinia trifoliorum]|uniref:C75b26c0-05be-41b4-8df2-d11e2c2044fd n=1 Tax=Sclerotinia trifoliorum TaxID=28548 RepID=A0A8H2ZTD0_9HELO|nr:c75b26c0-05be-41b4-8df2-d11e2c2044fd [Sclerotinia trifoliorum]
MPLIPKNFGRRKSTANAIENPEPPVESSFKVFERPQVGGHKSGPSFDGGAKFARGSGTADSHKEDNLFEGMKVNTVNRGSGASNTNTASTTDNSSRLSAASTAPSSMDTPGHEEWRASHDRHHGDGSLPPKTSSGFSLKNAGRSLSWGRNKATASPSKASDELPPSPTIRDDSTSIRTRAVTASSYASTATPPKLGDRDLDLTMGDDFGDMFAGMAHRRIAVLDTPGVRGFPKNTEILPPEPAFKSYSANRANNQPSPLNLDKRKPVEEPPYSWGSNDGLMKNTSPPPAVTRNMGPPSHQPPPVPRHGPLHQTDGNQAIPRPRSSAPRPDSSLKRSSAISMRRQSTLDFDSVDEDDALLRDSIHASKNLGEAPSNPPARKSWTLPSQAAYSAKATAKTQLLEPDEDEDLFESADLAQQFQEKSESPPPSKQAPINKVMTPAQFERYRQDQERLRSVGGRLKDEEAEEEDEENYEDDEDEAQKSKNAAKQRRKQEAHMSVYRQQMMKVTGESTPSPAPARPPMFSSQSTPNLVLDVPTEDGEEEDEEVPLAILAAHGFPNKNKPPTSRLTSMGSNPNLRGAAQGVPGIGGPLPVFARNLPQDPYVGAGLVYPANRESLAFGNGGPGSVHSIPNRGAPPGGLVGVIATEERSRAMRRGSPNPGYGQMPPGGFTGMVPPPMMGHMPPGAGALGMGQVGPMGAMPQPMLSPGDQAQIRMTEQMQSFMEMQMQFMQMMATNQNGKPAPQVSGAPQLGPLGQLGQLGHMSQPNFGEMQRPTSQQLNTSNSGPNLRPENAQRTMSMLEPSGMPWLQQHGQGYSPSIHAQGNGYAPSIAPSERSNVGLPGRYRPVSQSPPIEAKPKDSTMPAAVGGWDNKHASSTIKTVQRVDDDEDDEEAWAEMKKKREQKRSLWKSKKDTSGLSEMLGYTQ